MYTPELQYLYVVSAFIDFRAGLDFQVVFYTSATKSSHNAEEFRERKQHGIRRI